jgi:hypothetical protein
MRLDDELEVGMMRCQVPDISLPGMRRTLGCLPSPLLSVNRWVSEPGGVSWAVMSIGKLDGCRVRG